MSKNYNISIFNSGEKNQLYKRIYKGQEKTLYNRKQKLIKRIQFINSINDYYKQANNIQYLLLKNKENKKFESLSKIGNNTTINKSNYNITKKNELFPSSFQKNKNIKQKKKVSHLYIDSYDKKVKFSFPKKFNKTYDTNDTNKINKININLQKEEKNITNSNSNNNSKNKLSILNIKKLNLNSNINSNINKINNLKRSRSISLGIHKSSKKLMKFFGISKHLKKNRRSQIFSERKIIVNDLKINKNSKSKSKLKSKSKMKYSSNYTKDCIFRKIISNPNLKILYHTNESKIRKMMKSQNKKNKKNLTLQSYQKNLMQNSIYPLSDEQKRKLLKTFSKMNNYVEAEKKINLYKYLNEIQNKEKQVIKYHNNINQRYINTITKLGFSVEKYYLKLEKVRFKNIFEKKK